MFHTIFGAYLYYKLSTVYWKFKFNQLLCILPGNPMTEDYSRWLILK